MTRHLSELSRLPEPTWPACAQLDEIDENLMRSELKPVEEAEHLQRRKEVWEAMREQESGTTCSTFGNGGRGNEGFAEATKRARKVCQQARVE